jgi:hypothetical protein
MSRAPSPVTDLLASAGTTHQSVQERIEQRLVVLRNWLKEGIPPGKVVPGSLRAAREWSDPDLGIQKISSPNEFTRTHPQHRKLVADVAGLLTELRKRYSKPTTRSRSQRSAPTEKFDRSAFDRLLESAVSQWHSERAQRMQEKDRADAAQSRSLMLLDENAQMEKLIADLRRQLAKRNGLKAVE